MLRAFSIRSTLVMVAWILAGSTADDEDYGVVLLQEVDSDGDGHVNFEELFADLEYDVKPEALREMFQASDEDSSQLLDSAELQVLMSLVDRYDEGHLVEGAYNSGYDGEI